MAREAIGALTRCAGHATIHGSETSMARATDAVTVLLMGPESGINAASALQGRGFRVVQADTGEQALERLRVSRAGAVLLDVPADAEAALAGLARLRAAESKLPVVLLVDEGETRVAMRAIDLGATEVQHKPADIDRLANRLRALMSGGAAAPREATIAELMIPPFAYRRVFDDEPVLHVIEVVTQSNFRTTSGKLTERARRSVLVYDRTSKFLGCIRLKDVLDLLVPRRDTRACDVFEPGMFLARCKLLGGITAGELLGEQTFVDVEAPLIEAVQLMVVNSLINIPVLSAGQLVGILTDRNLLLEMCHLATGGL